MINKTEAVGLFYKNNPDVKHGSNFKINLEGSPKAREANSLHLFRYR